MTYQYCNLSLPLEERLTALAGALTFEEKVIVLKAHRHGGNARIGLPGYEFDSDGMVRVCRRGFALADAIGSHATYVRLKQTCV
jgi:hypothetical protein